jgi:hypothetical protein
MIMQFIRVFFWIDTYIYQYENNTDNSARNAASYTSECVSQSKKVYTQGQASQINRKLNLAKGWILKENLLYL